MVLRLQHSCRALCSLFLATVLDSLTLALSEARTNYGIVFDAGSSGSRIHIYTYRSGGDAGEFELVEDLLFKEKPGLSSHAADPSAAGASLKGLLDKAIDKVPKAEQARTPVFLMASAGLRALSEAKAEAILNSVRDFFQSSPFLFKREWVYIMSGKDEGLFGWVTVNYLMSTLNDSSKATGVIDLGGGSVQMVYHMPDGVQAPADISGTVVHGKNEHNLYVVSHANGLDRARKVLQESLANGAGQGEVKHPCINAGHKAQLKLYDGSERVFIGTGAFDTCAELYRSQFDKNAACAMPPCSFGGVFQPQLPERVFGFSYLYDRTSAIGLLDKKPEEFGTQKMSVHDIEEKAKELCASSPADATARFAGVEDANKWFNFCGDVTYLSVLLHHGFGFPRDAPLTMGNKIGDVELVWTLGAIIAKASEAKALSGHASEL